MTVVPDAGGVGGVGEGVGEAGTVTDAVGVGVGFAVGVVVAERADERGVGRAEPDVETMAGGPDVVGVVLLVWWPPVGAGDFEIPGVVVLPGCWLRSAVIKVPTITSSTSATRASRGSEAARRRPRTWPVPCSPESGPPGIGRGAVADRWNDRSKRSGAPGGAVPASRAPLAAAVPGDGTAPLGGRGAPG